ncbi:MAG: pyrimidine-nucleoside phosphorylase, partial [Erysipelotrichaceae bacterium]
YQHGNAKMIDNPTLLPASKFVTPVKGQQGYVSDINALSLGKLACDIGAGRKTKEDDINYGVGIVLNKSVGQYCDNEVVAYVYHDEELDIKWIEELQECFTYVKDKFDVDPIIFDII